MPKRLLGGYVYQDIAEWMADGESADIDRGIEALVFMMTNQPEKAAELVKAMLASSKERMTINRLLQSDRVLEASEMIWGDKSPLKNKE